MSSTRSNVVKDVMDLTTITASALGRKLGVTADEVKAWAGGETETPKSVEETLHAFIEAAASPARSAPRVERPILSSSMVHGDCREYLKTMPDESVDLILSDIPYGIGLDDWDVLHTNTNSAYMGSSAAQAKAGKVFEKRRKPINGWSKADREMPNEYYEWCRTWTADWLRVLKPGGSAFVFSGRRFAHRCISAMEDEGFNLRDLLAWERPRAVFRAQRLSVVFQKRAELGEAQLWDGWRVGNLQPTFEPIVWCFKPYEVTIADNVLDHHVGAINVDRYQELSGSNENILRFGFEKCERGHHEAQKPLALLGCLIEATTVPGQLVLDPFGGSGSTALAALRSGRRYIAIEQDSEIFDVAQRRLRDFQAQGHLPLTGTAE
jgi:site-specific DNA-methyltransferase (adenine-specific)